MKHAWKTTLFLLPSLLIYLPDRAQARVAEGQLQISPIIGIAVPLGTLRDLQRTGYTSGLSLDYMASEEIALGVDLNGTHFYGSSRRESTGWDGYRDVFYGCTLAHYGAHLKWYLTQPQYPNPFLEAGAGAVTTYSTRVVRQSGMRSRNEDEKTVLGYRLGVGLDLKISRLASGLATVTYHAFDNPNGGMILHFWTARFALAFQFRPI